MGAPAAFGRRLAGLGAVAAAGLVAAAVAAGSTPSRAPLAPAGTFAGPISGQARPIDRDLEPSDTGGLRRVRCAGGPRPTVTLR